MMGIVQFLALYALCLIKPSFQMSTPDSSTYVAAVVEFSPYTNPNGTIDGIVSHNVQTYTKLIQEAASQGADIIVFPECGLVSMLGHTTKFASALPNPEENVIPCTDASGDIEEAIRDLSCEAKNQSIYVVVNVPEKEQCTKNSTENCPEKGVIYYNSNVVFDRSGTVVARYRKFNLFGETGFSSTPEPEFSTFQSDFGVKFGIFTCFDIMFEKPAISLVKDHGVTDIVFPTAWFSELPFLTAVQIQTAWAHAMDVNFLASGYNNPSVGSTGSVIYAVMEGSLTAVMETSPKTQLLITEVPKKTSNYRKSPKEMDLVKPVTYSVPISAKDKNVGLYLMRDFLDVYKTFLLGETDFNGSQTLCHNDFCCHFQVKMRNFQLDKNMSDVENGYVYRLAVFDGIRSYTYATGGIQVCAIFACTNSSISSCGTELDESIPATVDTKFDHIRISGTFRLDRAIQLPNTLAINYETLKTHEFTFSKQEIPEKNEVNVTMETKVKDLNVYTFGIYGRDFTKDGQPQTQLDNNNNNTAAGGYLSSEIKYAFLTISICIVIWRFLR